MAKSILAVSDLHVGSTVALWPEACAVEDGGHYIGSKWQRWLMRCWKDMLKRVKALDEPPLLVLNGDLLQGANPRDGQLVTNTWAKQALAAEALLKPLVALCSGCYVIRGSEYHEGASSQHIEQLAKALGAKAKTSTEQYSHWELYLDLDGRVIHFGHSIGVSSIPHYEATVPLRDTLMLIAELHRFYGKAAPDLQMVVRSHRHRYIHVDAPPALHAVVTPAWQLKTSFVYRKGVPMLPQVGYVLIGTDEDGLTVRRRIYPLPALRVEVV